MKRQGVPYAVQAYRAEPQDSFDYFPTPPWSTRALCEWLVGGGHATTSHSAWEPAAGEGYMTRVLAEYFVAVHASDAIDYGVGANVEDFLARSQRRADWIITNPPFNRAAQFARVGIERANVGVALLVRTTFLEGAERHETLFSLTPPSHMLQFVERVPIHKGRLVKDGTTATSYCWLIWRKGLFEETRLHWIPKCRKRLERPEDYDLPVCFGAERVKPSRTLLDMMEVADEA